MWTVVAKTRYVAVSPTQNEMYPVVVYQCPEATCRYEIAGETGMFVGEFVVSDLVAEAMRHDPEMLIISEWAQDAGGEA